MLHKTRLVEEVLTVPTYGIGASPTVPIFYEGRGTQVWSNDNLARRQLTAPVTFSSYVAVADYEGYVHLLAQTDGRLVARTRVDRKGVRAAPIAVGDRLFVFGNSGDLVALRIE